MHYLPFKTSTTIYSTCGSDRLSERYRYIGENIRLLSDIIDYADENDIPGILFFADFEKAFDIIEHNFINRALKYFKFGNDIIRWIDVFYKDISSCVINNGHASAFFDISRGVRQGCPLYPYLFVICIELLAIFIRNDSSLRGISIIDTDVNREIKLSLYADDITLLLQGNETALRKALQIFDKFRVCFGLKLNFSKCKLLIIGALKNSNLMFCSDCDL